jgi:hypothetical protein
MDVVETMTYELYRDWTLLRYRRYEGCTVNGCQAEGKFVRIRRESPTSDHLRSATNRGTVVVNRPGERNLT